MDKTYWLLTKLFSLLSLSAFGGGNVVLPSMHMAAVTQYHWMTNAQFLDLFSLSKAAPGPSTLIVELIAIKAAGFPAGSSFLFFPALIASVISVLAMFVPSSLLLLVVSHFWEKIQGMPWQITLQKALLPITAGLILASTWIVAESAITGWVTGVMGFASLLIILRTKINPILIMALAAAIGLLLWG